MSGLRFFHGISFLLVALVVGCRDVADKAEVLDVYSGLNQDNYEERVQNFNNYLKETQFPLPKDSCSSIVILQTNLCNSCNGDKLREIFDTLTKTNKAPVYFILADNNIKVKNNILKENSRVIVFVDSIGVLKKYNLNFLRNININYCGGRIEKWMFI